MILVSRGMFGVVGAAGVAVAVFVACGSSDDHPGSSPRPDASGDGRTDAAADGPAADGGSDADAADADAAIGPPECDPAGTWGAGVLLAASTAADETFGAITPDELTIAWQVPLDVALGTADVLVADRAARTDPFGAAKTVASASGSALNRVALGPDGLTLVVVRADRKGFAQATRASRSASFGALDEAPFQINIAASESPPPNTFMDDPVYAGTGAHLFLTLVGPGLATTVRVAERPSSSTPWANLNYALGPELVPVGAMKRRPTGVSKDLRTLFFWDEAASIERAAWRKSADATFDAYVDVGARKGAQPTLGCKRIYYSAPGAASVDLYYADLK